jgi:uncharacterized damage-inducible protein DinB
VATTEAWRRIVASSIDWEQAHATLDHALDGLAPELRGRRVADFPHSVWELLDHIRAAQHDLLEFCTNENYHEPKWPDDYWPKSPAPPGDAEWNDCIAAIHREAKGLADFTMHDSRDLASKIPHGTGQTYLRTILVAIDHTSYHVGQIVAVRRLLDAWPH